MDTVEIATEKQTIEIGAEFMSTPQHMAVYWMEERVLWSPNFAGGREEHITERWPLHLFLR